MRGAVGVVVAAVLTRGCDRLDNRLSNCLELHIDVLACLDIPSNELCDCYTVLPEFEQCMGECFNSLGCFVSLAVDGSGDGSDVGRSGDAMSGPAHVENDSMNDHDADDDDDEDLRGGEKIASGGTLFIDQGDERKQCVHACKQDRSNCADCVETLAKLLEECQQEHQSAYAVPRRAQLKIYKAHSGIPDGEAGIEHHNFKDRPPHPATVPRSQAWLRHSACPALRARSKVTGLTVKMPYTVRLYRSSRIEVVCDWLPGQPTRSWELTNPTDSPWLRLPGSILQIFTIGDSQADVWIFNSGLYLVDRFMKTGTYLGAEYGNNPERKKGKGEGKRWLVLPLPHERNGVHPGWRVEQAVLSSFERIDNRVNIPLQFFFDEIPRTQRYIEIRKGTPVAQFIPAALPAIELEHLPMPQWLKDEQVELSRYRKSAREGLADIMPDWRELGVDDPGSTSPGWNTSTDQNLIRSDL